MYAHTFRLYLLGTGLVVGLYVYRTSYKQTLITTDCVLVCCNGGNYVVEVVFFLSTPFIRSHDTPVVPPKGYLCNWFFKVLIARATYHHNSISQNNPKIPCTLFNE